MTPFANSSRQPTVDLAHASGSEAAALPSPPNMTDHGLVQRVQIALRGKGVSALRGITVVVDDQHVILSGRVGSFYLKQIAQTTVQTVLDSQRIRNELEVISSS